jgi:hypothetical protein
MALPPTYSGRPPADLYPASNEYALRTQYLVRQLRERFELIIEERRAVERAGTSPDAAAEPHTISGLEKRLTPAVPRRVRD